LAAEFSINYSALRRGFHALATRKPWLLAFLFGLLHGLGFAGALAEVGLPQGDIPLALLLFNLGVELGQLLFVFGALLLVALTKRLVARDLSQWSYVPAYGIGAIGMFWSLQRAAGILT